MDQSQRLGAACGKTRKTPKAISIMIIVHFKKKKKKKLENYFHLVKELQLQLNKPVVYFIS